MLRTNSNYSQFAVNELNDKAKNQTVKSLFFILKGLVFNYYFEAAKSCYFQLNHVSYLLLNSYREWFSVVNNTF